MNSPFWRGIILRLLVLLILVGFSLAFYFLMQKHFWAYEAKKHAEEAGWFHAEASFRRGRYEIYELNGETPIEGRSTGRREGPFEIVEIWYMPSAGEAHRTTRRLYVDSHNDWMRRELVWGKKDPEKFKRRWGRDIEELLARETK